MSSSKAASLEDPPKQGRNESRVSGEETTNAEGACADMHVDMDIGIDSGDNMDDDYVVADNKGNEAVLEDVNKQQVVEFPGENIVEASKIMVETNTSLGEIAATSNVEQLAKVVQEISTAEVSTAEEVAKRVDEAEIAKFMDEKRRYKVSEFETEEQVAFILQDKEKKRAHAEKISVAKIGLQVRLIGDYKLNGLGPWSELQGNRPWTLESAINRPKIATRPSTASGPIHDFCNIGKNASFY